MYAYRSMLVWLAIALGAAASTPASAQIRASERGSVRQTIDGTTITVDYARPKARGRELFGALVPWDVVWTPGANWATTLETDKDVRIAGVEVAAGRYSVWMTPREDTWTLTLNDNPDYFHFQKPDPAEGTYNIDFTPRRADHVEMLTWSFPAVSGDGAVLSMRWGTTEAAFDVIVQPTRAITLAADERAPYVGAYALDVMPGLGWPTEARLQVSEADDGTLRAWMSFPIHPGDELTFDLIPAGEGRFNPGLYRDGALFNIEMAVAFEFEGLERAESVTMRGIEGTPFASGPRRELGAHSR